MKTHSLLKSSVALTAGLLTDMALAAPPNGTPYYTDTSSEYVQDATTDSLANLNMVLCIFNAMSPGSMLTNSGTVVNNETQVQYNALIDKNKCDSRSQSKASNSSASDSGSTSTPKYINAVVKVTRDPTMIP
jgi:hypothetical protein